MSRHPALVNAELVLELEEEARQAWHATQEYQEGQRIWKAMQLSPRSREGLGICQALLRGEHVPLELLDQDAVRRYGLRG